MGIRLMDQPVIVVDDEPSITRMVNQILKRFGFTKVLVFTSPIEVLEMMKTQEEEPSLLLADISMPEMNGVELANKLNKLWPGLPVIFMTGYADGHDEEIAATGHQRLDKPFQIAQLKKALEHLGLCQKLQNGPH